MTRYAIAAVVACLIAAMAFAYGWHIAGEFRRGLRDMFRRAKAEGDPQLANVDVETMPLSDIGIELSREQRNRVLLGDLILAGWHMWVPLLLAVCFGAAYLWPRSPTPSGATHAETPSQTRPIPE